MDKEYAEGLLDAMSSKYESSYSTHTRQVHNDPQFSHTTDEELRTLRRDTYDRWLWDTGSEEDALLVKVVDNPLDV